MHICNSMKRVYYSKDKSYSQPKQNERMVKIVWPKKMTFNFQKGTWGMASKTPYVMDIKQWRKFLERP
jgi:hypothetical protein